ncbi:hypothetical protein FQN57_002014 [Myotisia sp. PD_48]|nr:hypothetical protein FQN57_002014 [Myotisia sp. PD_48]
MLRTSLTALLVAAALEALPASALYTSKSPVLQVDAKSYDRLIAKSNHTTILEFYAPWCGHCQSLKPAYEKAAKSLEGLAKVAAIDCDEESNKPFCGQMNVKGFPTLKIIVPSNKPGKPRVEDYQGPRSAKGIVEAVVDRIPNHVKRVSDKDVADWLSQANQTAKAILFSDKGTTSALLKALAVDFLGSIQVAQIRSKEKSAVGMFGISSFPKLVLLPGGDQPSQVYDGELKKKPMLEFLSQVAAPNPDPAPQTAKPSKQKKKPAKTASSSTTKPSATETPAGEPSTDSATDDSEEKPSSTPESSAPKKPVGPPPLRVLSTSTDLKTTCLSEKTGTCLLALLPIPERVDLPPPVGTIELMQGLAEVSHKHNIHRSNIFPFYVVPEHIEEVGATKAKLGLPSDMNVNVIVINARRGWWCRYDPQERGGYSTSDLEAWVDAVKFGEVKKNKLPAGILPAAKSEADSEKASDTDSAPTPEKEKEPAKEQAHEEL